MSRYVVVKDNQVKEILNIPDAVATGLAYSGLIQSDTAEVGNFYVNGEFVTPGTSLPIPVLPLPYMTKLAFRNRFTQAEKEALYTAKKTNVSIEVFIDDVNNATYINPFKSDTIIGVWSLEQAGLLAPGRAKEILTTEITTEERWTGMR